MARKDKQKELHKKLTKNYPTDTWAILMVMKTEQLDIRRYYKAIEIDRENSQTRLSN